METIRMTMMKTKAQLRRKWQRHNNDDNDKKTNNNNNVKDDSSQGFSCIHRNPDYWQRPNDFWPERWLVEEEEEEDDHREEDHGDKASELSCSPRPPTTPCSARSRGITEGAYMPFAKGHPQLFRCQRFAYLVHRTMSAQNIRHFPFTDERLLQQQQVVVVVVVVVLQKWRRMRGRAGIVAMVEDNEDDQKL